MKNPYSVVPGLETFILSLGLTGVEFTVMWGTDTTPQDVTGGVWNVTTQPKKMKMTLVLKGELEVLKGSE